MPESLQIIDSHTEGEPTRVVVSGFPELSGNTMVERREAFRLNWDHLRRGLVLEPRGHDAIVGAVLTPPITPGADVGVIFFNDAGYLGMCGHGTIGVAETLRWLGRAQGDKVVLDTPVGRVEARYEAAGGVTIRNIPSRRTGHFKLEGTFSIGGHNREIEGEVAYGGNWFFFIEVESKILTLDRVTDLLRETKAIRTALHEQGICGDDGSEIDHVELFAHTENGLRNFVLCPGNAYDRSPCGTGTSAKLACLAASGELAEGAPLELESITGGRFTGRYTREGGQVIPWVTGRAFITGRYEPVFDPSDPFAYGF